MESFFDSPIFPFVIVTAIVAVRIVSMVLRRKRGRQQQESAARAAPAPVVQARADDDDDETFSAWRLSVNDDPPAPVAPVLPPRRVLEAPPRVPVAPVPKTAPDRMAPQRPASQRPAQKPARRAPGLSPLQQGVVWAEILGAPKGL
jgi:hypothetical protein